MVDKQEVAVVGGTPFDAQRGVSLLARQGFKAYAIGLSDNPDQQTALYQNRTAVVERFVQKVQPTRSKQLIIFCNSLSFMADWPTILPSKVWTLTDYYRALFSKLSGKKVAVLVAEDSMKKNLQALMDQHENSDLAKLKIIPNLELIKQLEASTEAEQAALVEQQLNQLHRDGFKEVVFGCTHFDHPRFEKGYGEIQIHQPGLQMIKDFVSVGSRSNHIGVNRIRIKQ